MRYKNGVPGTVDLHLRPPSRTGAQAVENQRNPLCYETLNSRPRATAHRHTLLIPYPFGRNAMIESTHMLANAALVRCVGRWHLGKA